MIVVVSPGGMGCVALILALRELGLSVNDECNIQRDPNDQGDIRHNYPDHPCVQQINLEKVIFVWNDPLLALFSHNRRGWLKHHHTNLTPDPAKQQQFEKLSDLWMLTINRDVYGIEAFSRSWLAMNVFQFDWRCFSSKRLAAFVGLRNGSLAHLCEKPRMRYDLSGVPGEVRRIYEKLDSEIR